MEIFRTTRRNLAIISNPSLLDSCNKSKSTRNKILQSLIAFSKYQGFYEEFKSRIKAYGIKWHKPNSLMAFLRILSNENTDVIVWMKQVKTSVDSNTGAFLEYLLKTGLRSEEGIKSFNLIIQLHREGRLNEYYNQNLGTLEHFKYPKLFLRDTKNVYVSVIARELLDRVTNCSPLTYDSVKMKLQHRNIPLKMNGLRDYFATFMIHHNLIREEVDLLQGRISSDIFVRHYWSPSFKELVQRTLKAINELEQTINT